MKQTRHRILKTQTGKFMVFSQSREKLKDCFRRSYWRESGWLMNPELFNTEYHAKQFIKEITLPLGSVEVYKSDWKTI